MSVHFIYDSQQPTRNINKSSSSQNVNELDVVIHLRSLLKYSYFIRNLFKISFFDDQYRNVYQRLLYSFYTYILLKPNMYFDKKKNTIQTKKTNSFFSLFGSILATFLVLIWHKWQMKCRFKYLQQDKHIESLKCVFLLKFFKLIPKHFCSKHVNTL